MESDRLQKVKAIFLEACDLSGDEVGAYLDKECAGDNSLRAKVEALLAQRSDSGDSAILDPTPKALSEPVLRDGDLIAGRFRILKFIGRGGMGEVYRAADAELGDDVALKTILPALVQDSQFLGRFRREVQLARQVTHPNVCRIFDVGRDQDRDLIFLTMEFLEGEPLSRMMSRNGRLPVDEAYPLLKQIAVGLDALHAKGIVHRDFKPGNVMLVSEAGGTRAVIGDFGLARAVMEQPSQESLSVTGNVLGTPDYMAPEQIVGKPATPAIDVYAFGLVMFEMVTGRKPFSSGKALGQAVQRVTEEPPSAKDFANDLPDIWDAVIRRCMARSAAERYLKAGEAIEDLAEARTRPIAQTTTNSDPTQTAAAVTDVSGVKTTAKRMLWTWVAVVIALVAAIGLSPVGRKLLSPARSGGTASLQDEFLKARSQLDHYYKPENLAEAVASLKRIVDADPKFALARAALCRAYYLEPKGETEPIRKAREQCNEAIALDRELAPPHITLGSIYLEEGKTDLAAQEIQQAIRLDGRNPAAYGALSVLYQAQGRTKEVEATIQKAVDLEPEDWRWHNVLGQYYKKASRFEEAAREFEKVGKLTQDNPFGFNNLGLVQLEVMKLPEARKAFEQAIQVQKSSAHYNNLGLVLQLEGKFDEAAEVTRKSLELNAQNYIYWENLAFCLEFGSPGLESAKEVYRKAILFAEERLTKSPKDARVLADLGSMYASLGEGQKGELLVRKALALDPENMLVHRRAATVYAKSGKKKEAVKELQAAMRLGLSGDAAKRNPELAPLMKDPQFAMDGGMPARK